MAQDVTLPALGESVTEGTVTRWLKNVGDDVAMDEPLVEISTDKVDTEIPSPFAGKLTEIVVKEDETVDVGAVLARIGGDGESAPSAAAAEPVAAPEPAAAPEPVAVETAPAPAAATPEPVAAPEQAAAPAAGGDTQDVILPALGESVTEGTVTRWLKNVGDDVAMDEPLVEISTDKVDTEIPSPFAGTLAEVLVAEDQTVDVGTVLARLSGAGGTAAAAPVAAATPAPVAAPESTPEPTPAPTPAPAAHASAITPAAPAATSVPVAAAPVPTVPVAAALAAATPSSLSSAPTSGYVTPLVRNLAQERDVNLATVVGTGVGGRIRKEDVLAAEPSTGGAPAAAVSGAISELRGTTVKMTKLRKLVAKRMVESLQTQAQLTTVIEVDVTRVWAMRAKAKVAFQEREGAKLTFLPFFTKAVAEALQEHAFLNASIVDDTIVYHPSVNLGIAVDTPKGLMVPVIKDAESKSLADHAREIADLAERSRTGKITVDELSGTTFSITNTGSGGTLFDTPVVASPQVGILATPVIEKRPVVIAGPDGGDVIAVRPMIYLPLSYDHRLVDGADAARFLQTVKKRIEEGAFKSELGL